MPCPPLLEWQRRSVVQPNVTRCTLGTAGHRQSWNRYISLHALNHGNNTQTNWMCFFCCCSFFVFLKGVPDQDIRLSTPGCRITGRGSGSFREFDHEIGPSLPRPFTPSNSHATKRVASSRATREKTRKILFGDQSCFSSFDHLFPICYNKCNDI